MSKIARTHITASTIKATNRAGHILVSFWRMKKARERAEQERLDELLKAAGLPRNFYDRKGQP